MATETPPAPGLGQAVEAAWRRAADRSLAEGEVARAAFGRRIARSLAADGPSLEYTREEGAWYGGARGGDGMEAELGISWPLWMPGQRSAAIRAARADAAWADANLAAARLDVAGMVRESAWEVVRRQAEHELARARVESLRRLVDDVVRRVDAGDLARSDALAAESDLLSAEADLAEARHALHAGLSRWQVLTGLDAPPDPDAIEEEVPLDPERLRAATGGHPALVAARHAAIRAREQLQVVRRSLGDPPELTLGAKEEKDAPGARSERSLVVAVRVPLGVGARRAQQRAGAQAALDVAEAELARAEARYAADVEDARLAVELADRTFDGERRRAALMAERKRLAERAFGAGELSLAELLLASRQSAEADASLARRRAARGLAHAQLLQVLGVLP